MHKILSGLQTRQGRARCYTLTLLMLVCSLGLGACGPNPTNTTQPNPTPNSNLKVSSILLDIFVTYETTAGTPDDKKNAAIQYARDKRFLNKKNEAMFELIVDPASRQQPITDKVKVMGGRVTNADTISGEVHMEIAVPLDVFLSYASGASKDNFLNDLAAFEGVKNINIMMDMQPQGLKDFPPTEEALFQLAQSTKNQGVKLMGADKWQAAGFRGKGAKIGVIDLGFKYYQNFLGTTLPANLEVKDISADSGGEVTADADVHGTAVLEIVASLAPEAEIYPVSISGRGSVELKQAFDYLVGKGVSIVSGSFGNHLTAGDGSSAIPRYVENLRQTKGIVFLFASGNEGTSHYSAFFNPDADGFHQFVPGVTRLAVTNPSSSPSPTTFILNWEQWGLDKSQVNDLDLFLLDSSGTVIGSSQDSQRSRDPLEGIPTKLGAKQGYYVRIKQKPGTTAYTKPFRLHLFSDNTYFQFMVPEMAVGSPADSKGALAVGAVQWNEDKWAFYSSQGPLPDGRFKPEIAAPAGVSSAAYEEEGHTEGFDGTSAACPEAAGVAGILKGANPNLSADQLEDLLKTSVKDLTPTGPDYATGYGRLDIGSLSPAAGIVPKNKAPAVPNADMTNLQYPVLFFKYYPTPQVSNPTQPKIGPTPLPTRVVGEENGATDESKVNGGGKSTNATPQPTATVGPKNQASPGAPPPAVSNTTFRDDFQDSKSGLPNKDNTTYQSGSYHLKAGSNQLVWSSYPTAVINTSNFSASVTAQGINDKNGLYGLVFWQQDANNYYLLTVTGAGQYEVSQYANGTYNEVIGWNNAPGWKAGQANQLKVTASQGRVSLFFNNQAGKIGQAKGQGSVGFAAGSYASGVEAAFSNFVLTTSR